MPRDGPLLGGLFQSLVTLSVRTYAQQNEDAGPPPAHPRGVSTRSDLIVERGDGRVLALEVKLASTVDDRDVRHLRWLAGSIGSELLDAAVITTGPHALPPPRRHRRNPRSPPRDVAAHSVGCSGHNL